MTEYVHLMGAEDVRSASITMSSAAEEMKRAANTIDEAVHRLCLKLDEAMDALARPVEGDDD